MNIKDHDIDVIEDIDELDVTKPYRERTDERYLHQKAVLLDDKQASDFAPLHWPMLDDGKNVRTNALGMQTGNWYNNQMQKVQQKIDEKNKENTKEDPQEILKSKELELEQKYKELEEQREKALNDGYNDGYTIGQQEGLKQGQAQGEQEGKEQGLEQGQKEGYKIGFEKGQTEGFNKGYQEAIEQGNELVNTQAEKLKNLIDMLANPMRQVNKDVTDQIIYIISRLCAVILKRELKLDSDILKQSIDRAISILPNAKNGAQIELCPEDMALVEANFGAEYIKDNKYTLNVNESLNPGDVLVHNDVNSVDFRVNQRIDELLNEFLINSAPAVDSALTEKLEGLPDYDENIAKRAIYQNNLDSYEDKIKQDLQDSADSLNEPENQAQIEDEKQNINIENEQAEPIDKSISNLKDSTNE